METKIEWCATTGPDGVIHPGYTFNPWWGCVAVSPACKHCYAETFANRFFPGLWGPAKTTPRKPSSESYWHQPFTWNMKAKDLGVALKVFSGSMCDIFEDHPAVFDDRRRLFHTIENTTNLNWLLLTKRIENVMDMVPDWWLNVGWPKNVWLGTTVESNDYAWRIMELCSIPAHVRFISCEPLLSKIDLDIKVAKMSKAPQVFDGGPVGPIAECRTYHIPDLLHWVIAGGESGHEARPFNLDWFRDLRNQCNRYGIPFFFKQFGEFNDRGEKVGKKAAGRLLDGYEYNDMPTCIIDREGTATIECLNCHMVSYNTNDIRNKYCGYCHMWHKK